MRTNEFCAVWNLANDLCGFSGVFTRPKVLSREYLQNTPSFSGASKEICRQNTKICIIVSNNNSQSKLNTYLERKENIFGNKCSNPSEFGSNQYVWKQTNQVITTWTMGFCNKIEMVPMWTDDRWSVNDLWSMIISDSQTQKMINWLVFVVKKD